MSLTPSTPPARLMDITRLARRNGMRPTGIDRVDIAYLRRFLSEPEPVFGLARTITGAVLLSQDGLRTFLDKLEGRREWGRIGFLEKRVIKKGPDRACAETDLRRLAIARASWSRMGRKLRRHLPEGTHFFNVSHSNLLQPVLQAVRCIPGVKINIFLHDAIPLDFPQYQHAGTKDKFSEMMNVVSAYADSVICNSTATKIDVAAHLSPCPPLHVALLGTDVDCSQTEDNIEDLNIPTPFFLCLGTIEPRKNHRFLIDLWEGLLAEKMGNALPHLVICGARGWCNEDVFERLDHSPLRGTHIHEFNALSDGQIQALMRRANGLVFPTFYEGYGLPVIEACVAGTPVLANDLPVLREFAYDIPIYAAVSDSYSWIAQIENLTQASPELREEQAKTYKPPNWDQHFNIVLKIG